MKPLSQISLRDYFKIEKTAVNAVFFLFMIRITMTGNKRRGWIFVKILRTTSPSYLSYSYSFPELLNNSNNFFLFHINPSPFFTTYPSISRFLIPSFQVLCPFLKSHPNHLLKEVSFHSCGFSLLNQQ